MAIGSVEECVRTGIGAVYPYNDICQPWSDLSTVGRLYPLSQT